MPQAPHRWKVAIALALAWAPAASAGVPNATLVGRAVLPADTFAGGPPCGRALGLLPINGRRPPFDRQVVQGISALAPTGDGAYWALVGNGFDVRERSADFELRIYRLRPNFQTGGLAVEGFVTLADPDRQVPWVIAQQFVPGRVLTGADLDPESLQRAADGSFWIGETYGPFLIHVDAAGKLLEPPIAAPDPSHPDRTLQSPENPFLPQPAALQMMDALRAHAWAHGAPAPALLPWSALFTGDGLLKGYATDPVPAALAAPLAGELSLGAFRRAGYQVVPWTVDDPAEMRRLLGMGVTGMISDRPDWLVEAVTAADAGRGRYLDAHGLIDWRHFNAQGHRGARALRPENTLPAFEAALDALVPAIETDCGITRDGVPVISHDPDVNPTKVRRADGRPYPRAIPIHQFSAAELQHTFIADRRLPAFPDQQNDLALSPVAVAFARSRQLAHPYVMPTLAQVFDFTRYYADYYATGPGRTTHRAAVRALNAARLRFDVETKVTPWNELAGVTIAATPFARQVAGAIVAAGLVDRCEIESLDYRTLLVVQREFPALGTNMLVGGAPTALAAAMLGAQQAWAWPARLSAVMQPSQTLTSGGFEGMAMAPDGRHLYPMLEKPLTGDGHSIWILEYDLAGRRFTGRRFSYPLDPLASSIGEFQLLDASHGLVIERDESEGRLNGFKRVFRVTLLADGRVTKAPLLDLLDLADPRGLGRETTGPAPGVFAMPFRDINSLVVLDADHLLLANDNNYPSGAGRYPGGQRPDDTEFVWLQLPHRLPGIASGSAR